MMMVVLAAMLAGGCQMPRLPRIIHAPSATVVGVTLTEQTATGSRVELAVELDNPNGSPLPLKETSYTLNINGQTMKLTDDANRVVPARGKQTVVFPAAFATDGVSLRGEPFTARGQIHYKPPGEWRNLLNESGVPLPSSSFSGEGTVQ